ncbi:hypothetical protein GE061_013014 [Apolygus lucorum]|uniref:Peptidase S1 domain-containing protein n=1 Tax=Apolygus lucorum TaxID=248454 RepID=A0A8S9XVZ9_APOLU|nr:hypothetical protein GE061_013014 [Apolygus lucorum]
MNSESNGWTIPDIISTTKERIARHQQATAQIQATDLNIRSRLGELYEIISALCCYLPEINEIVIESKKKITAIESENSVLREVATISRTEPSQPISKKVNPRDEEDTDTADEDDLAVETKWIRVKNKTRKTHKSPPEKQGKSDMLRVYLFASSLLLALILVCEGIINGVPVKHKEFPYVVSVTLAGKPVGAGVILSMSFVVSPCHLFAEFDGDGEVDRSHKESYVRVFAGTIYSNLVPDENQQNREPDLILLHPLCRHLDFFTNFDFAVLRLQVPFFPSPSIKNFEMGTNSDSILKALALKMNTNGLCTVVGWGAQTINYSDEYSNPSNTLKKTQVQLISWKECSYRLCRYPKRFCDVFVFKMGAICAVPHLRSSNCVGDDGGALICDTFIFGFASTPVACGEIPGKPNMFARFDVAFDFLKSQSHL